MRAIDWFNEHFTASNNGYSIEDTNLTKTYLYMAKKNGKPNDDFPCKKTLFTYRY